ncbi:uncharacterized protein LOC128267243 [Anopheles cruzii]|uniref:uncharacterized protein LOC128267243 n=1 Tax=Anopheles cruzii TaxID=68878 RepID=UPI0022EC593D|nr:uncharacterized protein LOC128267243 [Anopheles cruzii]
MEIEHLLRYLDQLGTSPEHRSQSQVHRIRSRHIIRSRVRYWLNDIVDEMRKKSPASVQKWVDSIQMPNSGPGTSDAPDSDHGTVPMQDDNGPLAGSSQLAVAPMAGEAEKHQIQHRMTVDVESLGLHDQHWGEDSSDEQTEELASAYRRDVQEGNAHFTASLENVLCESPQNNNGTPAVPDSTISSSTPKVAKLGEDSDRSKQSSDGGAGLSIRNFLSKKSLLGKFNRSSSNLDRSPTTPGDNIPPVGAPDGGQTEVDVPEPAASSTSAFGVGKSKINEFYDKLNMNKAKYGLIKAKKLDIRNMLGVGGNASRQDCAMGIPKTSGDTEHAPVEAHPNVVPSVPSELVREEKPPPKEQHENDHSITESPQQEDPLEVSVVDVDPSDAYEFSFDESFPKSDELIPGMISEEDEEKENILDTATAPGGGHHPYAYDVYLNPAKPRAHRMGIGRIGRSSSENPRATGRRYNLMEIGRSFSEMNDDDESFAISEGNNSCPNPSSLNTSSSINNGSTSNLTRSVPVSPIPRTSSKLSIQQEHHSQSAQQQQQMSGAGQHNQRRRSTMLVKDSSLQSDSSRCSSVESLLNARKPDPEKILLNLGFGPAPHSTDVLSKIPKRFLKPSQVRGVDTEAFLRQQQLSMQIHENSVLGYRGLVGNPHIPPSMIVAKIMERFQENDTKTRLTATGISLPLSDSRNSSGPPSPVPMTRHGSLATGDGRLKF